MKVVKSPKPKLLEDQLYDHVKGRKAEIIDVVDLSDLINELYKICEDYYKPKLKVDMPLSEVRILMDEVFTAWNIMVSRLSNIDHWSMYMFLTTRLKGSYRYTFLSNPIFAQLYYGEKD